MNREFKLNFPVFAITREKEDLGDDRARYGAFMVLHGTNEDGTESPALVLFTSETTAKLCLSSNAEPSQSFYIVPILNKRELWIATEQNEDMKPPVDGVIINPCFIGDIPLDCWSLEEVRRFVESEGVN